MHVKPSGEKGFIVNCGTYSFLYFKYKSLHETKIYTYTYLVFRKPLFF